MLEKKYYRLNELIQITGMAKSTIYQWVREGKFPAPALRPSRRLCLYSATDIEVWFAAQGQK